MPEQGGESALLIAGPATFVCWAPWPEVLWCRCPGAAVAGAASPPSITMAGVITWPADEEAGLIAVAAVSW
ncbi:hypothetical protein ACFQ7M_28940 [Streptomyces massasporeus]